MNKQFAVKGLAVAVALAGVVGMSVATAAYAAKKLGADAVLTFDGVSAPLTDAEKREVRVSAAEIDGQPVANFGFHTLMRSGQELNGIKFGQIIDADGNPIRGEDGEIRISNANEHTSLLPVGKRLFSVSQHETRPGAFFLLELDQNKKTGELTPINQWQLDQSNTWGGWVHCAASVTPWNTHLASEEYEPNAAVLKTNADVAKDDYSKTQLDYYTSGMEWNPYYYGWNTEITVKAKGKSDPTTTIEKHFAMGRMAIELAYVMPDQKTAYITDDGTNVSLFMFVADKKKDLSAGTLYALKWNQTSSYGVGAADIEWINLGHATDEEIKPYLDGPKKVTFDDIFATAEGSKEGQCPTGFTGVNTGGYGFECLQVKPGMEKVASRLESRRYAAMMGATTEFRKEEGITFAPEYNSIFMAMSEVERGMEDFKKGGKPSKSYDLGGSNDIRLDSPNKCGAVYQLPVGTDKNIGSDYVVKSMTGLVVGRPVTDRAPQVKGFEANNSCHINGIANPDNLTYMSGYDTLIIGEDTGSGHQNDAIWAYNLKTSQLTRIETTPYGSETTSPYWYPDINGWAYLMSVVQHPYGESDEDKNTGHGEAAAYTGYIGPFPAKKMK
ncbi:PhoX family protein [Gynuella sunshinyii]|uniref:Putative phosphatase n=1 Tax=Gynuella sunshinyii YC6258 TaxID=1445510 RepID=A0A0C5VC29_9GAMM|nr:alkaline phosphatase PhoX [Gynuella sunshinyii]AJQ96910.1 putative phosphatase [Gynuella sunshinyii YC6258]